MEMTTASRRSISPADDLPDLPREVSAILDWWLPRVHHSFEGHLESIALFGGLALGEFAPGWSDVDTCIIVRTPVSDAQASAMNAILAEMDERFVQQRDAGWRSGQGVQGAVITAAQAAEPGRAEMCFYAWSAQGVHTSCDPFSSFDRYLLANHGRLLEGAHVPIAPPSRQALLDMTLQDLQKYFNDSSATASRAGPIMLAGLLHWAARSLVFWREGIMLPKSAALRREIETGSPFVEAFRLALEVRALGSACAASRETQLRQCFRDFGPAIYAEHKRVLESGFRSSSGASV
jgi:hypothetical protein